MFNARAKDRVPSWAKTGKPLAAGGLCEEGAWLRREELGRPAQADAPTSPFRGRLGILASRKPRRKSRKDLSNAKHSQKSRLYEFERCAVYGNIVRRLG